MSGSKSARMLDGQMRRLQIHPCTHILCTDPSSVFDFFSLDVEGAEMSVLESIDFDRTAFGVVLIEADEHNEMKNLAMRQFLELRGYTFLCEWT